MLFNWRYNLLKASGIRVHYVHSDTYISNIISNRNLKELFEYIILFSDTILYYINLNLT